MNASFPAGKHELYPKKPDKTTRVSLPTSERICLLEQVRKLIPLLLQVRIATDVLLVDEDVRYRALLCHLLERVLDGLSVILKTMSTGVPTTITCFHLPTWSSSMA